MPDADPPDVEHADPPDAMIAQATVISGVGATLGEDPIALVRAELELTGRLYGTLVLGVAPDLAREISTMLAEAADAADADLERYLATGNPRE